MNDTHDDGERAALYALGALDAAETAAFEAHVAGGCARCATELASHRTATNGLGFAARPVAPPPSLRARVLEAVGAEEGYRFVRRDEGEWSEVRPGLLRKELGRDAGFLLRLAPGGEIPLHAHESVEHCYVMSGEVQIAGRTLCVGDYHVAAPGSVHDGIRSTTGCLLLIVPRPVA